MPSHVHALRHANEVPHPVRCASPSRALDPAPPTSARHACLLLAAVSTLLKVLVLVFPSVHVSPKWVLPEEQHRGNIAREILDGPLLPIEDYQHAPNVGGSVVVGVLATPFVAVFGESIAAVRAVPILFNALAVAMMFLVLDRFVSRRAAWIGGVLFAIAPPGYSLLSITAFGTHVENNALTLVVLWLYLKLHAFGVSGARERPREGRTALAFGLCAGFATYFGYFFALALAAMLAFEFLHDKFFVLRRWFRFALIGFAIGFAPWIAYNAATDMSGLSIYEKPLAQCVSLANVFSGGMARLELLFTDHLPNSFFFRGLAGAEHAADAAVTAAIVGIVALASWQLRREISSSLRALVSLRHRPTDLGAPVLFLLYVPCFVVAFAAADVGVGTIAGGIAHDGRYAAPLYPFVVLVAACALDRLCARGAIARRFVTVSAASFASLCLVGTLSVCDVSRAGGCFTTPGTSDAEFARWMAWTWRTDIGRLDRIVRGLETKRSASVADGMIFALAQGLKWGMRADSKLDPPAKEKQKANAAALNFLHERVADAYKPYCEPPRAGERIYAYRERDRFWAEYQHRARAARVRESLALRTVAP